MFKQYRRKSIAELRPVLQEEILGGPPELVAYGVSISVADADKGSPKLGDMIARNHMNHADQWLVAAEYFKNNFEEIK